jgi:multiple sugar transport system substrate-binding protein
MKQVTRRAALAGVLPLLALPAIAQSKQTITWITHPVIFEATGKGELLKKFTADTGLGVEVTTFPSDALAQRIPSEFISGSDAFDVMNMTNFWTSQLARYVDPLEPYMAKQPLEGGIGAFSEGFVRQYRLPMTAQGKLYAIPNRVSVDILFYRKDLLEAAKLEVPKTLDEFHDAATRLTRVRDGRTEMYGAVYEGIQSQQGLYDWYDWAAPLGVDILNADGTKPAFNTPQGVKATQMRRQFVTEGLVSPGVLSYSFDDAINAMAQDKAAMSMMFDPYWAALENPNKSLVAGKIGYAPLPRDPTVRDAYFGRGWALFINARSRRKDGAWEFIRWITAPEQQLWMALNYGNAITRPGLAADPRFIAKVPDAAVLVQSLPYARVMPVVPQFPRIMDTMMKHISAAQAGSETAEQAMELAERDVASLLQS